MRQLLYSGMGVLLSLIAVGASESRFIALRLAEQAAVNGGPSKADALSLMRSLGCEKDLTMDIGASQSGGLSGLFLPIDAGVRRELFFEATGRPFTERAELVKLSTMPDRYLGTHVVGDLVPGLSLARSEISGAVNAKNLTSNLDWTFVFKNTAYNDLEAGAEVGLPPGAVVSNVTLWEDGVPNEAGWTRERISEAISPGETLNAAARPIAAGTAVLLSAEMNFLPLQRGMLKTTVTTLPRK
jgi:hypothetical protein